VEADLAAAVHDADVVWLAFDTPVDDNDRAQVDQVLPHAQRALALMRDGAVFLSSSQLPVGTLRRLEDEAAAHAAGAAIHFACAPENLRLGNAIHVFRHPDRVVVGTRGERGRETVAALFAPITSRLEWMSIESAEMTKHAINAFLAMSVTFINEIAVLCEQVGADAKEVERGLKTEQRIGPNARLSPGAAFAGGTLARDVVFLDGLGHETGAPTPLLSSVLVSNSEHRGWARRALQARLGSLSGTRVAIWGLTYKPGTDTLRRSTSVELCRWLHDHGASVVAFDPAVRALPADLEAIELAPDAGAAVRSADALIVATEWPELREVGADVPARHMRRALVLDPNRFLASTLGADPRIEYVTVGKPRS
jgi:UDPglucose 6-dehydrogenase